MSFFSLLFAKKGDGIDKGSLICLFIFFFGFFGGLLLVVERRGQRRGGNLPNIGSHLRKSSRTLLSAGLWRRGWSSGGHRSGLLLVGHRSGWWRRGRDPRRCTWSASGSGAATTTARHCVGAGWMMVCILSYTVDRPESSALRCRCECEEELEALRRSEPEDYQESSKQHHAILGNVPSP